MARVIGLDIGTTSTIGILLDTASGAQATAALPVTLSAPRPGWAEEDPLQWWSNAVAIIGRLLSESGTGGADVAAVGVTGMVPALVALDERGRLLRPSIQQSDGRVGREVAELMAEVDPAAFVTRTGNGINQQLIAPKLRWLRRHEPEVTARIATIFGSYDYFNWRLAGARRIERNWALEAGFVDLRTGRLDDRLIALAGIDARAIPTLAASDEIVGGVSAAAAAATGLAAGTPVVAGCADHVASAFVAGIVEDGDVLLKFGGAGDILLAADHPRPDSRVFLDHHLVPGRYLPNGCMAASGAVLNWIAATFARHLPASSAHGELDRLAQAVPAGSEGLVVLPYFLGEKTPIHDPAARGAVVGLTLHHTLGHVWRAALEAVAFGFRHHLDVFAELGYGVRRVVASDGGAASRIWMQITADVIGLPVELPRGHPGSCLGAAYVAAVAVGALPGWGEIRRFVAASDIVEPDPRNRAAYEDGYRAFRALYPMLRPFFHRANPAG